jgi:FlaA1/EpsC-like NDP-sugar epimerase
VIRYMGYRNAGKVFLLVILSVLIWSTLVFMAGQQKVPRSTLVVYGIGVAALMTLARVLIGAVLEGTTDFFVPQRRDRERKPILIYGASKMGVELLRALQRSSDRIVVGFIDSSSSLWGQYVQHVKIFRPERLAGLIDHDGVREVILALPESQRRSVLKELERHPVEVKIMPDYEDVAAGRVGIADLRPVGVGDLLGRDPVPPVADLLARNTQGKSVLVTGAGGSIGSELVRQILKHAPRHLVLLDLSEAALYTIEREVERFISVHYADAEAAKPSFRAILGSVTDPALVSDTLRDNAVETIYHAAAYKHVPLVEENPIAGLWNNAFGAAVVADCAKAHKVERVVLISTDKAVRPTNVMGASKRVAELILQAAAADGGPTVFTMVRFGNVLDSSGSVVPLFRNQIKAGGPITVTHPEIERYFMSIPEAAELVLQAGAMAKGGEVFVLHMGDPVKIVDLARLMVRLSGLTVRDSAQPDGDIEIVFTGLRPGEKLYEELLIGVHTTGTEHPRILKSGEPFLAPAELKAALDELREAMFRRDSGAIEQMLLRLVEGYDPRLAARKGPNWLPSSDTLH